MRWRTLGPRLFAILLMVFGGVYYIAFDVLGVHLGPSPYTVTVMLPRAGGLYPEGDVTYRGVPVGKVSGLVLSQTGVEARLQIRHGVRIPSETSANIRELSAIGEQYMDLVPTGTGGPYLHNGSVIPAASTTEPLPIGQVLSDSASLVKSINPADLNTIEQILTSGFTGSGPDLRRIIVTGQDLTHALIGAASGTVELINDGNTVLNTALATNSEFQAFTASLAKLSANFASENADFQSLFQNGAAATQQVNALLGTYRTGIQDFIDNFGAAGSVSLQYQEAVHSLFEVLPVVAGDLSAVGSNGQLRGELGINTSETVCPYIPASQMLPPTKATNSVSLNNSCPITAPDLLQRGAQYAPVVP